MTKRITQTIIANLLYCLEHSPTMIYDVNSPLFAEFIIRTGQSSGPKAGSGPSAKGPKAKGSDGKYQGE